MNKYQRELQTAEEEAGSIEEHLAGSQSQTRRLLHQILKENCEADFITAEELGVARAIEEKLVNLDLQHSLFRPAYLHDKTTAARDAYWADPTDANLDAYERAAFRRELQETTPNVRKAIRALITKTMREQVDPFVTALVDRALLVARTHLAERLEIEERRTLELIGQPLKQSEIVAAAESVVAFLEGERQQIAKRPSYWLALFGYSFDSNTPSWASGIKGDGKRY